MKWWLALMPVVLGVGLLVGTEWRWRGPLYCIERPGQLWGGDFGLVPADAVPQCPQAGSYRAEVRQGAARVEQYRLRAWQPTRFKDLLVRRGVAVMDTSFVNPDLYETFFQQGTELVYVLAQRTAEGTLLTLSGKS